MALTDEIANYAQGLSGEFKEDKGVYSLKVLVAEREAFLSKKKLEYIAKFRIDEANKVVKFTEMLKESGFGLSSGDEGISPGFGFKTETFKTGAGPREGTIEEQSNLFGKKYEYKFDFKTVRQNIENLSKQNGFEFEYHITAIGL